MLGFAFCLVICLSAGLTNKLNVTAEDEGLPGKPKNKTGPIVAKVVGFPGFILTRPKWMVPERSLVIISLI